MLRSHPSVDFHEKRRARRLLYSPLTLLVLAALIAVAGYNAWDMYGKSRRAREALTKTNAAYGELATRQAFLDRELARLSTDEGVEAEIRERFGVAKAGEEVIVVLSEEESPAPSAQKPSFWSKVKGWLSGSSDDYVKGE